MDQSNLVSQLTQAVDVAIERTNYVVNVAASGSTDCHLQLVFNYSSAPDFVHRCHLDLPAHPRTTEDRALLRRLGLQDDHETFGLVLDRAGHDAASIAHTLALLLLLLSGGSEQIEEVDWDDLDENRGNREPFFRADYPLPVLTFSNFLESLERERGQVVQEDTQLPWPPPQVRGNLQELPDAQTPNWSGPSAPGGFSLANAALEAGLPDLATFIAQVAMAPTLPDVITGYAQGLSKYGNKDEFRVCLARMTYAVSFGHTAVSSDAVEMWVDMSNQTLLHGNRLKASTCNLLSNALWAAINDGRGTNGLSVVAALSEVDDLWGDGTGTGPTGDDRATARLVSAMTVMLIMSSVFESTEFKRLAGESLAGLNPSGTYVSLPPRDHARLMWQIGRAWAEARGIDFDEFVRRHEGIDD